ncbi:MAG: lysylphosphatidylglycerol synthase transmembrane domain-containing protein [Acidimicrobiales bacterium]
MLALRIGVSAAMLALLLSRVHLSSLLPERQASTIPWLVVALVVWMAAVALSVVRWQRVLDAIDHPAPASALTSYTLAGLFVANFLPSTIGGDVLRVVRLSADNGDAPASFASVVLERLTGFVVLPMITLAALAVDPSLLGLGAASKLALALSVASLVALVAILAVAASTRLGGRLANHENWPRFVGAVHLGIDRIRRRPAAAATVMVSSFAYQLTIILAAFAASRALGLTVGLVPLLAFVPVVAIAQVLPISVGGLGLREGALVLLLAPLGVGAAKATALGLLLYGINLVVSLLGAAPFAMWSRNPRVMAMAE